MKTMGTVAVAALAALATDPPPPAATITFTCRRTKSSASAGTRSSVPVRAAELDGQVAALDVTALAKTLPELGQQITEPVKRPAVEQSKYRHRRLLRAHCERPSGCRAAEKRSELTSPHIRTQAQRPALYRLKRVL